LTATLFFVIAPGTVAGLLPWSITRWQSPTPVAVVPRVVIAALMIIAGLVVLVRAFIRFVTEGRGTPLPAAPPERLVVGGDYRYVRNPMYVAILSIVLGQAVLFASPALVVYAVVLWVVMAAFVHWHEEPLLRRRFGDDYATYCRNVRAWRPRLRPWTGPGTG
jgi:protein-S-isoprenylcysteine O-methyltransferase Ste14